VTDEHGRLIYGIITIGTTLYNRKAEGIWAAVLCSPQQDDVSFEHARAAALQLIAEYDPIKITVALVLQKARGIAKSLAPSTVEQWDTDAKLLLEGPQDAVDPTATGPAARGAQWAKRHGIKRKLTANPKRRAELAEMLGNLGERMNFHCIRCFRPFIRLDVDAYVLRCMDAGREDKPEPPRWCARCTPVDPPPSDEAVPF